MCAVESGGCIEAHPIRTIFRVGIGESECDANMGEFGVFDILPDDEEDAQFLNHIVGTLVLNRDTGTVDHFILKSTKPFRAKLVAKIKSFRTRIDMQKIADGVFFPAVVDTKIRGRAFGLKKIDADVEVRFSDFQRVEPGSP
ncbi:MAG: hypothetical protein AAF385_09835 [Pseudomonadota bacterium]